MIYDTLTALGLAEHFDIDFGDAGGLEYYTGLTFKVYVPGWGTEIGSGGRYDNLISNFGNAEPAVGFSFALDGLVGAMTRSQKLQLGKEESQTIQLGDDATQAFRTALALRNQIQRVKIQ